MNWLPLNQGYPRPGVLFLVCQSRQELEAGDRLYCLCPEDEWIEGMVSFYDGNERQYWAKSDFDKLWYFEVPSPTIVRVFTEST